jgi:hypothetical protein
MQSMTSENPNKDPQLEGLGMPKRANGKSWLPEPLDAEATEWLKNPRKFGRECLQHWFQSMQILIK